MLYEDGSGMLLHTRRGLISDSGTGYVVHASDGGLSEEVICRGESVGGKFVSIRFVYTTLSAVRIMARWHEGRRPSILPHSFTNIPILPHCPINSESQAILIWYFDIRREVVLDCT